MHLNDLHYIQTLNVPAGQSLFRVQRAQTNKSTVKRGPLKLAPIGLLNGRFDLANQACAYLAETPETALYESVFRREATGVSLSVLRTLELLAVQTSRATQLADLRPHAPSWPVLQSLRLSHTQELAQELSAAGFDGVIYRSAQQAGHDCMAVFDPASSLFKEIWTQQLLDTQGRLNRFVALASVGSCIPLTP